MSEPLILISRIWINRWQRGQRGAHTSNMCVALAYGSDAGSRLDLKPRGPGREKLASILTVSILSQEIEQGLCLSLRLPECQMDVNTSRPIRGARPERVGLEVKLAMDSPWEVAAQTSLGRLFERQRADALTPWLGPPLLARAQWSREDEGFHATGGWPGVMRGYSSPLDLDGSDPRNADWAILLDEAVSLGLAADLDSTIKQPAKPAPCPRL